MKLPDANVLLYAVNAQAPFHRRSVEWLDRSLSQPEAVGFDWLALLAFSRLATRTGLFDRPLTIGEAIDVVDSWLTAPSAVVVEPSSDHSAVVRRLLEAVGMAGNLVNDAHLAALAIEHNATIVTFDRDFGRFPGVRTEEPA